MTRNLAAFRKSLGMSQKDFAASLGIGQTTYNGYEKGNREPRSDFWVKVAQKYNVSVDYLMGYTSYIHPTDSFEKQKSAPAYSTEALDILNRYEAASPDIKAAVKAVLSVVTVTTAPIRRTKKILLFGQAFAAGTAEYPGDMLYEEYETDDMRADFAIHVNGDSMEPYLHDGSIALGAKRYPRDGEVGAFFLDGGFLVKQVCVDSYSNVYLFSLNRERSDADETIWRSAGRDFRVIGTILMDKRIPLPDV